MRLQELLERVQARVAGGPAAPPSPPVPPAAQDPLALLARFEAEAGRVGCTTSRAASGEEARGQVLEVAARRGIRRAVCWRHPVLAALHLAEALTRRGITLEAAPEQARDPAARARWLKTLSAAELGISGIDTAVAETGTVLLHAGSGRGRLVTCLPPAHLAVLTLDALVADLFHLPARWRILPSAIHLITGPSRTADIELSLTRGVHGPAEVHILACLFPLQGSAPA